MAKNIYNLTIFLLKDTVDSFQRCLKNPEKLQSSDIKEQFGLDGKIYYCASQAKPPRWKAYLEELSIIDIDIDDNSSNKAIMLVKTSSRIMAVVFGYGRSFLKEEYIERNFGFKVALNLIDPKKMRSINAATIEDMVVTTQRQTSYSTTQDEFGLNITNDIMKGITGAPFDKVYGNQISGKDSLVIAVEMELKELKEKLGLYLKAFEKKRYRDIGFEWVDNVGEVRDSILKEALDNEVVEAIKVKNLEHLHIAPPETTDWDRVVGFCFSGIGKSKDNQDNYTLNLDLSDYLDAINPEKNILQKIKRDRLYVATAEGSQFPICSIYNALVFQTEYEDKTYIFCSGNWYQVDKSFFETVQRFIIDNIIISDVTLPECPAQYDEGQYNSFVADSSGNYCLMDKVMVSVEGGPKKIEACDIFTKDKQFIHVKNRGQSSQLSHLLSQGKVSAQCFVSDKEFRKQVYDCAMQKFNESVFDFEIKPEPNDYEVIYAFIEKKENVTINMLPFFTLVNLMITAQELDRIRMKYSVCFVKRQDILS